MQLANTEEFQDGKSNGALGEVFIRYARGLVSFFAGTDLFQLLRCNNVLYIISLFSTSRLPNLAYMFAFTERLRKNERVWLLSDVPS